MLEYRSGRVIKVKEIFHGFNNISYSIQPNEMQCEHTCVEKKFLSRISRFVLFTIQIRLDRQQINFAHENSTTKQIKLLCIKLTFWIERTQHRIEAILMVLHRWISETTKRCLEKSTFQFQFLFRKSIFIFICSECVRIIYSLCANEIQFEKYFTNKRNIGSK